MLINKTNAKDIIMDAEWITTMSELSKARSATFNAEKVMDKAMRNVDSAIKHKFNFNDCASELKTDCEEAIAKYIACKSEEMLLTLKAKLMELPK
jgi:hypothetical protein